MALYPGIAFWNPNPQFFDANGEPLSLGSLTFYLAGTTTLHDTFDDPGLDPLDANTNPIMLNAAGRSPVPIFLDAVGYKVVVKDAAGATVWTFDYQQGWNVFPATWGTVLGTPTTYDIGDTIPATERYARIDSSAGAGAVYLSAAADMTQPLTIKNMGGNAVTITSDGVDTIEGSLGTFVLPAASSPTFPSVLLASDGISDVSILSSHGV